MLICNAVVLFSCQLQRSRKEETTHVYNLVTFPKFTEEVVPLQTDLDKENGTRNQQHSHELGR